MSNVIRWNPIIEFEDLLNRYNRQFSPARSDSGDQDALHRSDWTPVVDIAETDNGFEIQAELAGISKDDVKVSVHEGVLSIQGERRQEKVAENSKQHRVERAYGAFLRRFTLPENVSEDDISASFRDGVLTLALKKVEPVQPRSIEVEVH